MLLRIEYFVPLHDISPFLTNRISCIVYVHSICFQSIYYMYLGLFAPQTNVSKDSYVAYPIIMSICAFLGILIGPIVPKRNPRLNKSSIEAISIDWCLTLFHIAILISLSPLIIAQLPSSYLLQFLIIIREHKTFYSLLRNEFFIKTTYFFNRICLVCINNPHIAT